MTNTYLMKPRVKPANEPSKIQNRYWRNVLARARANYHRGETPFSNTAHHKAHTLTDTIIAVANDLGVNASTIYTDEVKAAHDSFIRALAEHENPFAAYHAFVKLEKAAKAAAPF